MDEKDFKKIMIPVVILGLAVLSFLIIKPLLVPIIFGLLFAYIFYPLYKKSIKRFHSETFSAFMIVTGVLLIILIPLLLLLPLFIRQLFEVYISLKDTDISAVIIGLFPYLSGNQAMASELLAAASHFNSNISNIVLAVFQNTLMSLPEIMFAAVILLFTFYFSLKEGKFVKEYILGLFPFPKDIHGRFFEKFEQVTNSVVFGHIIIGLAQGVIAGIGYYLFGLPNALLLTLVTALVGVIPVVGPWLVWIPADLFLFINGDTTKAIQLLVYGLLVISWIETLLRPQVIAKKADMNPAIALIGAIGGTYAFGLIGFLIGPLLLAYLILLVELYKNKNSEESIVLKECKEVRS